MLEKAAAKFAERDFRSTAANSGEEGLMPESLLQAAFPIQSLIAMSKL